jgi:hypothetical protein
MKLNVHEQNDRIAREVEAAAADKGLSVRHNVTSSRRGAHQGWHRWVALRPGVCSDYSIRSRAAVVYTEAAFSRNNLPSVRGEGEALTELLVALRDIGVPA